MSMMRSAEIEELITQRVTPKHQLTNSEGSGKYKYGKFKFFELATREEAEYALFIEAKISQKAIERIEAQKKNQPKGDLADLFKEPAFEDQMHHLITDAQTLRSP